MNARELVEWWMVQERLEVLPALPPPPFMSRTEERRSLRRLATHFDMLDGDE